MKTETSKMIERIAKTTTIIQQIINLEEKTAGVKGGGLLFA